MPAADALLDAIAAHAIELGDLEEGLQARVLRMLRALELELTGVLDAWNPGAGDRRTFRIARAQAHLRQVQATITRAMRGLAGDVGAELDKAVQLELDFGEASLRTALPRAFRSSVSTVSMSPQLLAELGRNTLVSLGGRAQPMAKWLSEQSLVTTARYADHIRLGQQRGEGIPALTRRIFGRGRRGEGGIWKQTRPQINALVRTSVQAVAQVTRERLYAQNAGGDKPVKGVVLSVTLDGATSRICVARSVGRHYIYGADGRLKPYQHTIPWGGGPPYHGACRTQLLPWLKTWKELGLSGDSAAAKQLQRLEEIPGQLPDFNAVFARNPAMVNKLLGRNLGGLFRDGKLALPDLLDANGKLRRVGDVLARVRGRSGTGLGIVDARVGPRDLRAFADAAGGLSPAAARAHLERFAVVAPADSPKWEYFTHTVRDPAALDAILKNGVRSAQVTGARTTGRPDRIYATPTRDIRGRSVTEVRDFSRDTGAGYVVFRRPAGRTGGVLGTDYVPGGPTYSEAVFSGSIPRAHIVKVVRYPEPGFSELDFVRFLLGDPNSSEALPATYLRVLRGLLRG